MTSVKALLCGLAGAAILTTAGAAHAADEEIQVYVDDLLPKGGYGLDVHLNATPKGRVVPDYLGQQASEKRWRLTPEWAYGLSDTVELGLYLPLATLDGHGKAEIGGVKGRIKYIAPHAEGDGPFWGLNLEIGRVRHDLDINPWNGELKTIAGVHRGPWTVAWNFNVDFAISGPAKAPTSYQLATMVTRKLGEDFDIGVESYNTLGDTKAFGPFSANDQQIFLVMDKGFGKGWDLNLGVGWGYGQAEDQLVVKAIIGVPIGG